MTPAKRRTIVLTRTVNIDALLTEFGTRFKNTLYAETGRLRILIVRNELTSLPFVTVIRFSGAVLEKLLIIRLLLTLNALVA